MQCSVQHAPHNDLPYSRHTVRRQFKRKRGAFAAKQGFRKDERHRKRCRSRKNNNKRKHTRRRERTCCGSAAVACKKKRNQRDKHRKPSVAGHKRIRQDRNQPFPFPRNDSAPDNTRRIAAEAHAHCQSLFAAGIAARKPLIKVKRNPRKHSEVLQQREKREKNRHRRQHDRHDPCRCAIHARKQRVRYHIRHSNCVEQLPQQSFKRKQPARQQFGRVVCPAYREIKHAEKHQQHQRQCGKFSRQYFIYAPCHPPYIADLAAFAAVFAGFAAAFHAARAFFSTQALSPAAFRRHNRHNSAAKFTTGIKNAL